MKAEDQNVIRSMETRDLIRYALYNQLCMKPIPQMEWAHKELIEVVTDELAIRNVYVDITEWQAITADGQLDHFVNTKTQQEIY